MKMNANPVRGTKDFLPKEEEIRDYVNIMMSAAEANDLALTPQS